MVEVVVALALAVAGPAPRPRDAGVPVGQGTSPPVVRLTSPSGGWSVARMLKVEGTISDSTVDPVEVSINGDRYLLRARGGHFSREFPAAAGKNVVVVRGTNRGGTGEAQATTYAQVAPMPLRAVLTSDTDGVYTDLHVYEPTAASSDGSGKLVPKAMAHVFWANTASPSGGTFYLNEQSGGFDEPGYGPYLYVHRAPPRGIYLFATNYWPSGDKAHTLATLNLTLFEGTPGEQRRVVRVPLATRGTTRVLAWVNVLGDSKALVYVPGQDPLPDPHAWPANLDQAARALGDHIGDAAGD